MLLVCCVEGQTTIDRFHHDVLLFLDRRYMFKGGGGGRGGGKEGEKYRKIRLLNGFFSFACLVPSLVDSCYISCFNFRVCKCEYRLTNYVCEEGQRKSPISNTRSAIILEENPLLSRKEERKKERKKKKRFTSRATNTHYD